MYCQGRRASSTLPPEPSVFQGRGFAHLSKLVKLTKLDVSCCDLETPHFGNVTTLQSLTEINVSWCPWLALFDAMVFTKLPNVKVVYCRGTFFTDLGISAVAAERPDIVFDGATFI
jgi:hypothetical protein